MSDDIKGKKNGWGLSVALGLSFGWASWAILILNGYFPFVEEVTKISANNLGDFLAGWFAPMAFGWFVYTAITQRRELEVTRNELKNHTTQFEQNLVQSEISNLMGLIDRKPSDLSPELKDDIRTLGEDLNYIYQTIAKNRKYWEYGEQIHDRFSLIGLYNYKAQHFINEENIFSLLTVTLLHCDLWGDLELKTFSEFTGDNEYLVKQNQQKFLTEYEQISNRLENLRWKITRLTTEMDEYFDHLQSGFSRKSIKIAKMNSGYGKLYDDVYLAISEAEDLAEMHLDSE